MKTLAELLIGKKVRVKEHVNGRSPHRPCCELDFTKIHQISISVDGKPVVRNGSEECYGVNHWIFLEDIKQEPHKHVFKCECGEEQSKEL